MNLKFPFVFILFAWSLSNIHAQSGLIYHRIEQNGHVQLKWFSDQIFPTDKGFNVYRSEDGGSTWLKLNQNPLKPNSQFDYKTTEASPELKEMMKYFTENKFEFNEADLGGLILIKTLIYSDTLAKFIGIQYNDETAVQNTTYQYKITEKIGLKEIDVAITSSIQVNPNSFEAAPSQIDYEGTNKKIKIGWKPEPSRYYGVHVYKSSNGRFGDYVRLTEDPIIYNRTEKSKRSARSSPFLFLDEFEKDNNAFYYKLVTVDYFGKESGHSEPIYARTNDVEPPLPPRFIKTDVNDAQKMVTISWEADTIEDLAGFNVLLARNKNQLFSINKGRIAPDLRYTEIIVDDDGKYFFQVQAFDTAGNVSNSDTLSFYVADKTPPPIPDSLIANVEDSRVFLKWKKIGSDDFKSYNVYRVVGSDTLAQIERLTAEVLTINSFTDVFPENRVGAITYMVNSEDTNLNFSEYSNRVTISFPDRNPPPAPFIATTNFDNETVNISWQPIACTDLEKVDIYVKTLEDTTYKKLNQLPVGKEITQFTHRKVQPNQVYQYCLLATDTAGNVSDTSNIKQARTPAFGDEVSFIAFNAKAKKNSPKVQLQWEVSNADKALGYTIYAITPGQNQWVPLTGKINQTSYELANLAEGEHQFEIRAYTNTGKKAKSNIIKHQVTPKK